MYRVICHAHAFVIVKTSDNYSDNTLGTLNLLTWAKY